MIEPTSRDIGRHVVHHGRKGVREAVLISFDDQRVYVRLLDEKTPIPVPREQLDWSQTPGPALKPMLKRLQEEGIMQ
jgi:hypothetical protein